MNRWTRTSLIALAAVAVPAAAWAQAGHDHHQGQRGQAAAAERFVPVQALLRMQAQLGLTAEQLARIEGVQQRLAEQNEPLVTQLRELGVARGEPPRMQERRGQMSPEQRQQMRERMQERRGQVSPEQRQQMRERMQERRGAALRQVPAEAQPLMEQMRANSRAALSEAHSVLTPDQQALVQEMRRDRSANARGQRGTRGWTR